MGLIEIYEDKDKQGMPGEYWDALMSDEEMKRGSFYALQYALRKAEIQSEYGVLWEELKRQYLCERAPVPDDPDFPNSFIPIVTPTVEGQVASIMESRIDFRHYSNNPAHRKFMPKLDAASEYYRKRCKFVDHFKDYARDYDLYGNAFGTVMWEEGFGNVPSQPKGFPRIVKCNIGSVIVDGAIKDVKDIQFARYIIHEIGYVPISWAREEYGDKYADALIAGYSSYEADTDVSVDDSTTFTLLHVWTRNNEQHNLQLIEMDANGLIFRVSDPAKPYYKFVNNEYPFFASRMIPQEGKFFGIGDGVLLRNIQHTVNNLTDELELAARFNAQPHLFIDPKAQIADGQITSNPADIIIANSPREYVFPVPAAGISPVVQNMISYLQDVSQRATRFHEIMTGTMSGVSATATQIRTQVVQGSVGIKDKKTDLARAMEWADMYALKLCLEKWDKPFWAYIGENKSEYIDVEELAQQPAAIPVTGDAIEQAINLFMETDKLQVPEFEVATKNGKPVLVDIDFETTVIIGEAMPRSRIDMYNILLGLSQIQIFNKETGTVEPLISPDKMREVMEDLLGMKLRTDDEIISEVKKAFMPNTAMNPIGAAGTVQVPQGLTAQAGTEAPPEMQVAPETLQSTVPQMLDRDKRRLSL